MKFSREAHRHPYARSYQLLLTFVVKFGIIIVVQFHNYNHNSHLTGNGIALDFSSNEISHGKVPPLDFSSINSSFTSRYGVLTAFSSFSLSLSIACRALKSSSSKSEASSLSVKLSLYSASSSSITGFPPIVVPVPKI